MYSFIVHVLIHCSCIISGLYGNISTSLRLPNSVPLLQIKLFLILHRITRLPQPPAYDGNTLGRSSFKITDPTCSHLGTGMGAVPLLRKVSTSRLLFEVLFLDLFKGDSCLAQHTTAHLDYCVPVNLLEGLTNVVAAGTQLSRN